MPLPRAARGAGADAAAALRPPLLPQLFGSTSDCAGMDTAAQPRAPTQPPTGESPGAARAAIEPTGAALPRAEVEAPAGEKRVYSDTGYYAQAVYTPEQQARLGIEEHPNPNPHPHPHPHPNPHPNQGAAGHPRARRAGRAGRVLRGVRGGPGESQSHGPTRTLEPSE